MKRVILPLIVSAVAATCITFVVILSFHYLIFALLWADAVGPVVGGLWLLSFEATFIIWHLHDCPLQFRIPDMLVAVAAGNALPLAHFIFRDLSAHMEHNFGVWYYVAVGLLAISTLVFMLALQGQVRFARDL
ncbi:MAG TPA: hypothetical protein VEJ63_04930 [Planctomycetota bacterium]|nr:hypothetical protein [Planctomycetota bacterium]